MMTSFKKRWLITGVSSGIGQALAKVVLERGDSVIGTSRDADAIAGFSADPSGRAMGIQADMSDLAQIEKLARDASKGGPIDVLVNNAGQSLFGASEEVSLDEVRSLFEVNVFGPWALAQALLPQFRARQSGTIIHISSGCGLNGTPGLSGYCASKYALEGFTETMALETARFGIRTMLVEPGAIATRFISHSTTEAAGRLPAYDFLTGDGKAQLAGYYATSASPPEAVADAILAAFDQERLPMRLMIGADMSEAVRRKAAELFALAYSCDSAQI